MATSYSLTEDAFKRTKAAVQRVEGMPRVKATTQRRRHVVRGGGEVTWIGTLQGALAYGSSATVMLKKWDSGSSSFVNDKTDTCYPWMMNTGDSIATNVQVVGGTVGGKKVVFNAACKNIYGS